MKNGNASQVKGTCPITDSNLGDQSVHASISKKSINIKDGTINGYDKNLNETPYRREVVEQAGAYQEKSRIQISFLENSNSYRKILDKDLTIFKGVKRTKLTEYDLKLILYLIIRIKPFKYIGDRSLSQTKKWELIQTRFASLKLGIGNESANLVIPTIRTLQRQLANTIKKGKLKAQKEARDYLDESAIYAFIDNLNLDSDVEELEMAVQKLHELSQKFKSGQGSPMTSLTISLYRSPPSSFLVSKELPMQSQDKDQLHMSDMRRRTDMESNRASSLEKSLKETHTKLRNNITSDTFSPDRLFELVNIFVDQVSEFNYLKQEENRQAVEETKRIIQQQLTYCEHILEQNQQLIKEQESLSKQLMADILSHLSKRAGTKSRLSALS